MVLEHILYFRNPTSPALRPVREIYISSTAVQVYRQLPTVDSRPVTVRAGTETHICMPALCTGSGAKQVLPWRSGARGQAVPADKLCSREVTLATPTPTCFLFKLREEEERNIYFIIPTCQALRQVLIAVHSSQLSVKEKLRGGDAFESECRACAPKHQAVRFIEP